MEVIAMSFIREKLIQFCDKLPSIANTRFDAISLEYVPCDGYKVGNTPPEDGWQPWRFPRRKTLHELKNRAAHLVVFRKPPN